MEFSRDASILSIFGVVSSSLVTSLNVSNRHFLLFFIICASRLLNVADCLEIFLMIYLANMLMAQLFVR